MIRKLRLYGELSKETGFTEIELDVNSPRELIAALRSQVPNFRGFLSAQPKMAIVLSDEDMNEVSPITTEVIEFPFNKSATHIHLLTPPEGAGMDPLSWAIALYETFGISMTTSIFIVNTAISVAVSFAVGAVIQALSPSPDTSGGSGRPEERPSFLFNGAANVVEQGYPVPLVYGVHTVGSIVVSAGIDVTDIPFEVAQEDPPANGGGTTQPAVPDAEPWQWSGGGGL